MAIEKKIIVTGLIIVAVLISTAATSPYNSKSKFKNLRILPKDISSKKLEQIMIDEFEDGLGVNCGFCHAEKKGLHSLDYASDEKPEKEIARAMMKMTMRLNKKYFHLTKPMVGDSLLVVSCSTCHKGVAHPDSESIK